MRGAKFPFFKSQLEIAHFLWENFASIAAFLWQYAQFVRRTLTTSPKDYGSFYPRLSNKPLVDTKSLWQYAQIIGRTLTTSPEIRTLYARLSLCSLTIINRRFSYCKRLTNISCSLSFHVNLKLSGTGRRHRSQSDICILM